jgi:DNA polymerase-3 subunit epsilon
MTTNTFETMIARGNWLVLDTETTGLARPAEICQIAVVDARGVVRLDTLVKPVLPIPADATRIHGITNADVTDAPSWTHVSKQLAALIDGCDVIIYNAEYDRKLMHLSDEAAGLGKTTYQDSARWHCAMLWYAAHWGEKGKYGDPKWQSLSKAMIQQKLPVSNAHNALGDVLMTRQLICHICHFDSVQTKLF